MSDLETMPPVPPEPPESPESPESKRPLRSRRLLWIGTGAVALAIAAAVALGFWAGSASFQELVRKELIARLESGTGGRVEIRSFQWRLFGLEAEAKGLVIHGLEAPGEAPYLQIDDLRVDLSVLGFWTPRVLLRELDATHPAFHLIVYSNGATNQPRPRKRQTRKPGVDTLFDLQAGHVSIRDGEVHYEDRAASFDFQDRHALLNVDARDVSLRMAYVPPANGNPESYRIETGATDINVLRGGRQNAAEHTHGHLEAALDLTRNAAYLRWLRLAGNGHTLVVSGALEDFSHPRWQGRISGELDMRLLEPLTGYPFTPEGVARLDLTSAGSAGQFRTDGTVHVDGGAYVGTGVVAHGVGLDARVHADPEHLLISSIVARLHPGGQIEGNLDLAHWLPPVPGAAVMEAAGPRDGHGRNGRSRLSLLPPPPTPIDIPVDGKVSATFRNVSLDTLLDMVGTAPFQRLGLNTLINGPAKAVWTGGDNRTLAVTALLNLTPSGHNVAGEAPTSGLIDATYTQRDGAVEVHKLDLRMPDTAIQAHGHLGTYPLASSTALAVDFHTHNLWELDPVLRDLGMTRAGRSGAAALPVTLAGQADFHGTWSGSLLDPHLAGSARATQIAFELPPNANDRTAKPRYVGWDVVEGTGSYSAARLAFDHAELQKGQTAIAVSGSLDASLNRARVPEFDANSVLKAHLHAAKLDAGGLLWLTGYSLPISGLIDAQLDASGPLHALNAAGWVEMNHGALYGEPVNRVRLQGKFANQEIALSSFSVNEPAGSVSGAGSYDLKSRRFQLAAKAASMDIARIEWLRAHGFPVSGKLSFTVNGNGTTDDPRLEADAALSSLALGGDPLGGLEFSGRTSGHVATYDMTTRLQAAVLTMHGETAIGGDNFTRASVNFSRFNIGALLKMAHVAGLNGESALAGNVTLQGPLARPQELRGEARLQELAVTISGVHLRSQGGVHATLANSRISLDPLHVTGEDTDLHAQGGLTLKDSQQLDLAASGSVNLKLAQSLDPDLTASGTSTFQVEAHGPLKNPGLRGRVDFQNGSLALGDLPNGLSQLHGHLEFNQNRLEVKSLTAMTGGGLLSLSGYLAYQNGIYADLSATGNGVRIRYPQGVSSLADARLRLQGTQRNLLLSGNVLITRFTMSPDLDIAALATQSSAVQPVAPADAPSNHIRLDLHLLSSPQLNFQNAFAKLAGDVDLRLRGTLASPSLLGRVSITEGSAMIAGTRYDLQRGDISFTNPVRIQPSIDLNATAHVSDYDITLGLHGTPDKLAVTYRSDPPLPEADVVALLALGRTENQQRIYTQQQEQTGANPTTDLLLGGALNATVSSRVQKLFGAGSVKVDPNYLGALGNSTSRIIVEEQLGSNVTLTYATNVNTTAQQLIQAEVAINHHVSVLLARDESGVFSMVFKATRRYR